MILPHEQEVVSLELAKKMKDAGFRQDTLYKYDGMHDNKLVVDPCGFCDGYIAAYTSAEMGVMFIDVDWDSYCRGKEYGCYFYTHSGDETSQDFNAPTEADARAKMALCLARSGLLAGNETECDYCGEPISIKGAVKVYCGCGCNNYFCDQVCVQNYEVEGGE